MSKKKIAFIAGGTFAGLVAVYFILKRYPHASELEDLTQKERAEVQRYISAHTPDITRIEEEARKEAEYFPPRYRGSWLRIKAKRAVQKLTGDHPNSGE